MSLVNWTLHETPYGRVAATVDSKGKVYMRPAFGIATRYPNDEAMRYVFPVDELEPNASTGDVQTSRGGGAGHNVQTPVETGLEHITNTTGERMKAALTVNGVPYENVTIDVDAQANEYMRRYYSGPYPTAHSSYMRELTTSARKRIEAMAVELYPTIATPTRIAEAQLAAAEYNNTDAQKAYEKADTEATAAYRALHEARNNLAAVKLQAKVDAIKAAASTEEA